MKLYKYLPAIILLIAQLVVAQQTPAKPKGKTVAEKLGYPADSRLLVIHAEDFGMAHSINRATMEALEKGWVTSASILVPCPWFPEVAEWAKLHPDVDLGVRLDLNNDWERYRWGPVSTPFLRSHIVDKEGYFPLKQRYVALYANMNDVEAESNAQIDKALQTGLKISHLDNHMKVMMWTPDLFKVYWMLGQERHLPIVVPYERIAKLGSEEGSGRYVFGTVVAHREDFPVDRVLEMLQGIKPEDWKSAYETSLAALPPGVYMLSVHLGYDDEELRGMTAGYKDWGSAWRQRDLDLIRSSEFQKFLRDQKFVLVNWKDLAKAMDAEPSK